MSYKEIYEARQNHYGTNYMERMQNKREHNFETLLKKRTQYRIKFAIESPQGGEIKNLKDTHYSNCGVESKGEEALLERSQQDNTKTIQHLLTRTRVKLPVGTIIRISDRAGGKGIGSIHEVTMSKPYDNYINYPNIPNGATQAEIAKLYQQDCDRGAIWMVYWLEEIEQSGYNKYTIIRMKQYITKTTREGYIDDSSWSTYAYMYGQEDNMIKNELRSRSRMDILYDENLKDSFLIVPLNENINKDDYFEIAINYLNQNIKEPYVVVGYDRVSAPGIEYITVDPRYFYDTSPVPEDTKSEGEEWNPNDDDSFFIRGGRY